MALIRCEDCGEEYSDTYQVCPFCEEEEAIEDGRPIQRRTGPARNRSGRHILSVLTMLAVVLFLCGGVYLIWGNDIAARMGIREPPDNPDHTAGDEKDPSGNQGVTPGPNDPDHIVPETPPENNKPEDEDPNGSGIPTVPVDQTPETPVKLNKVDISMNYGEGTTLTASGGSGVYTWTSSNTELATVKDGKITIVGGGGEKIRSVYITASDGYTEDKCVVYIRANTNSGGGSGGGTTTPPATGSLKLNRDDFTIAVGETFQLKASGNTGAVTWSIKDSSIATIAADGTVTGVKKGRTQVTATVDGQTLQCWVSIK